MNILNLYAGIGGNRKLWGDEHQVTAVEYDEDIANIYKQFYPNDIVVIGDAHQYLLDHYKEFDFIWASPPCPTHSRLRTSLVKSKPVYPDMRLYEEIIFLKYFCKGDWVVENVIPYYTPLMEPVATIDRHFIWSNKPISEVRFSRGYQGRVTNQTKEVLAAEYGIELPEGTKNQRKLLRNAVHPDFGAYILQEVQL